MKAKTMKPTNETGHTKGPWIFAFGAIYHGDNADTVEEGIGRLAQADRDNPHTTPTERDANCRLIAASPDLLAALEHALCYMEHDSDDDQERIDYAEARAAISKAKGQP